MRASDPLLKVLRKKSTGEVIIIVDNPNSGEGVFLELGVSRIHSGLFFTFKLLDWENYRSFVVADLAIKEGSYGDVDPQFILELAARGLYRLLRLYSVGSSFADSLLQSLVHDEAPYFENENRREEIRQWYEEILRTMKSISSGA